MAPTQAIFGAWSGTFLVASSRGLYSGRGGRLHPFLSVVGGSLAAWFASSRFVVPPLRDEPSRTSVSGSLKAGREAGQLNWCLRASGNTSFQVSQRRPRMMSCSPKSSSMKGTAASDLLSMRRSATFLEEEVPNDPPRVNRSNRRATLDIRALNVNSVGDEDAPDLGDVEPFLTHVTKDVVDNDFDSRVDIIHEAITEIELNASPGAPTGRS
ncbi:hypothetical protein E4U19_004676 [Claviceps sp. Clav32 group G5]|nr:hypothetical protein E4U19_004676 [Claviceps sp. Clav32 group G5]KAG6051828.1 hypothetical protein E4U39_006915 [Claviceps sp. Clav50 group G5]